MGGCILPQRPWHFLPLCSSITLTLLHQEVRSMAPWTWVNLLLLHWIHEVEVTPYVRRLATFSLSSLQHDTDFLERWQREKGRERERDLSSPRYFTSAIDWMFKFPPKFSYWNLTLNVMVLGGGTSFGTWLGHESGAFMNGIDALIKETPESSLVPSTMWGHGENQKMGSHQTLNLLAPWPWTSQTPEPWE